MQHGRFELMEPADLPFNTIISRAFTRLEPLVKLVAPLMTPGNTLVAMLGPAKGSERPGFAGLAQAESLELHRMVSLELPRGRGGRTLLFFKKV